MNITFDNNSKYVLDFTLNKYIVPQTKLNPLLVRNVQENKIKIKILKKQFVKLNKALQIKTDLINNLNNNIKNINNNIKKIQNITKNLDKNTNTKTTQNFNKKKEKKDKINTNNNGKRKNNKQNKKFEFNKINKYVYDYNNSNNSNNNDINNSDKNSSNKSENKEDKTIFCFQNFEILGNKKVLELLVLFNIVTIMIISILVGSIYYIKSGIEYQQVIDDFFSKKMKILNTDNENEDKQNNDNDFINNNDKNKEYKNSIFENEVQELYIKEEIIKKGKEKAIDVDFILKYSSIKNPYYFDKFYNESKGVNESLIILKNSRGKKFAIYSRNIYELLHVKDDKDFLEEPDSFALYSFNMYEMFQYTVKNFFDVYITFIQSIYKLFSIKGISIKNKFFDKINKYKNGGQLLFGNIIEIEIYKVKYIK